MHAYGSQHMSQTCQAGATAVGSAMDGLHGLNSKLNYPVALSMRPRTSLLIGDKIVLGVMICKVSIVLSHRGSK
jgi:hypothetical protein